MTAVSPTSFWYIEERQCQRIVVISWCVAFHPFSVYLCWLLWRILESFVSDLRTSRYQIPFFYHRLTKNRRRISNHKHCFLWDVITRLCRHVNGRLTKPSLKSGHWCVIKYCYKKRKTYNHHKCKLISKHMWWLFGFVASIWFRGPFDWIVFIVIDIQGKLGRCNSVQKHQVESKFGIGGKSTALVSCRKFNVRDRVSTMQVIATLAIRLVPTITKTHDIAHSTFPNKVRWNLQQNIMMVKNEIKNVINKTVLFLLCH